MIDKDHAPEGYYAVKEEKKNSCVGCDFYRPVEICSKSKFCMAGSRPDDTNVILKKKENYMSKIYSAVDAEDAEHLIGKEVYCGDTLTGIKEHGKKGVLKSILYGYNNFRFLVDGLSRDNWNLIQEAEQPTYRKIETIEEAETFFGKVARNKDGTMIFTVSKAFSVQRGAVFINGHSAWKLFEDYTINGKPFGIAVNEQ